MPRSDGLARLARLLCTLGLVTLVVALSASALQAQSTPNATIATDHPSPRRLTDRGRFLLAGSVSGNWSDDAQGGYGSLKRWFVRGSPELAYFVRDRIGVGLSVGTGVSEYTSRDLAYREYQVAAGVTGAFEVPLSRRFGLMFRPFLGYLQQWRKASTDSLFSPGGATAAPGALLPEQGAHTITQQTGSVRLWLGTQLLYHFSSSVALAAGPDVWVDFIVNDNGARKQWADALSQGPVFPGDSPRPAPPKPQLYRVQVGLSISLLIGL